jgi:hypothetical protein
MIAVLTFPVKIILFPFKFPKVFLFLLAVGLMLLIGINISHGFTKHWDTYDSAKNCFNNNGAQLIIRSEEWPEKAKLYCLIPGEGIAIQVVKLINGKWEEITSYVTKIENANEINLIEFVESDMGKYGYYNYVSPALQELIIVP